MYNSFTDIQLSSEQKNSIIASYPLFTLLDAKSIQELASKIKEVKFDAGSIIVKEGDEVNSVLFIVSGSAEVSKRITTLEKTQVIPIAVLKEGDAIGLSDVGFFSETGIRTATVTAFSDIVLLVLDLNDFANTQQPEASSSVLKELNEKILLMNFIQKTHLFQHFSKEKIRELASKVSKIKVSAGTLLFKQGDIANKCYFILSGTVAIFTKTKNDVDHILARLEVSSLFGEGAFLDEARRNASARAETDCELFVLEKDQITAFMPSVADEKLTHSLSLLRLKQLRPSHADGISVLETTSPEGETVYLLEKNSDRSQLRLSRQDYVIWQAIDGKNTLQSILDRHADTLSNLTINDLYLHISNMATAGFVKLSDQVIVPKSRPPKSRSFWEKLIDKLNIWKSG